MPIYCNEGGVLHEVKSIPVNENGVVNELDSVKVNEGGVLYEIFNKTETGGIITNT